MVVFMFGSVNWAEFDSLGHPKHVLNLQVQRVHPISESQLRLVIQKQLTTTDVGSLGRIILPKVRCPSYIGFEGGLRVPVREVSLLSLDSSVSAFNFKCKTRLMSIG